MLLSRVVQYCSCGHFCFPSLPPFHPHFFNCVFDWCRGPASLVSTQRALDIKFSSVWFGGASVPGVPRAAARRFRTTIPFLSSHHRATGAPTSRAPVWTASSNRHVTTPGEQCCTGAQPIDARACHPFANKSGVSKRQTKNPG
jgi:hypothetical protein